MMAVEKIVPQRIMARVRAEDGGGFRELPVVAVEAFPPSFHPKDHSVREDCWLVLIHTTGCARFYGFAKAWIGADLRMHVELLPGQERDEVVGKWEGVN